MVFQTYRFKMATSWWYVMTSSFVQLQMGCSLLIPCVLICCVVFYLDKKHTNLVYVFLYGASRLLLKEEESDFQVLQYA